jgi:hypothetical protein
LVRLLDVASIEYDVDLADDVFAPPRSLPVWELPRPTFLSEDTWSATDAGRPD